jgi:hypothetical protein
MTKSENIPGFLCLRAKKAETASRSLFAIVPAFFKRFFKVPLYRNCFFRELEQLQTIASTYCRDIFENPLHGFIS